MLFCPFCRTLKPNMSKKRNFRHMIVTVVLLCALCALFFFNACGGNAYASKTFFAMDTVMSASVEGDSALLDRIEEIAAALEKKLSVTNPSGVVYALNERGDVLTDEECAALIRKSVELSLRTNGAFDITVYPLVKSWGFTTGENRVPTDEEIGTILPLIGYQRIHTEGNVSLQGGTEIDLGGIAKGYLTDVVVAFLKREGVKSATLNFGGNVYVLGKKNGKTDWKVALSSPDENGYAGILTVSDRAVITSGNYERYFDRDGVRYGHIIDPVTGRPCDNDLLSVTVVGENGTECDAFSTALFVMGREKATAFARENGLSVVLIDKEKKTYVTRSLSGVYTQDEAYVPYGLEVIE